MSFNDYTANPKQPNPHLLFAGMAHGKPIRRIHTQWQKGNSSLNVATFGIPDKNLVMHLTRSGRECLSVDIRQLEKYSMAVAIRQAQDILNEL